MNHALEIIWTSKQVRLFTEPRCRTWAAVGVGIAAVGVVGGIGASVYSASNQPKQPDMAASSAALSNAEADMLPIERQLAGAAQTGGKYLLPGYTQTTAGDDAAAQIQSQIDALQNSIKPATPLTAQQRATGRQQPASPTTAKISEANAKIADLKTQLSAVQGGGKIYKDSQGRIVPESEAMQGFGEFGGAQTQATLAKQNAANQLELQQKYGPEFIQEALNQQELANPQGVAARKRESELIQQQIDQPIINPISTELENQLNSRVSAGKGLDDFDTHVLNQSVASALGARGGSTVPGDFTSPLTTGFAGEGRQLQGIDQAKSFLASGGTPEDIKYRQEQQNLANLSAEISGQTPTSEFGSLSNASRGPNPTTAGAPLPTIGNTLQTGGNAALTTQQQQAGQANNWMAGISTVLNASGALGQLTAHA